jgi:hypothetical protein
MKGTIIVQSNAGIAANQLHSDFSVYPNPAGKVMTIKAGNNFTGSKYIITDQAGRQVLEGKLTDGITTVDISQLTSGIYSIGVAGQRKTSIKFMKK